MIQQIHKHFDLEGVTLHVEGQPQPTKITGPRAEIKVFGPHVIQHNGEEYTSVTVRIELTFPRVLGTLFTWYTLAQKYVEQAKLPLHDGDDCLILDDTEMQYRGAIENLEYCFVEISYHKET